MLVLSGEIVLVWLRIDAEARRADELGAEVGLRGDAVTTLAEDIRILRKQVKAEGGTPAAPDPSRAVDDLPDRVGDPVLVPGPRGPQGASGKPAPTITPSPGPQGCTWRRLDGARTAWRRLDRARPFRSTWARGAGRKGRHERDRRDDAVP